MPTTARNNFSMTSPGPDMYLSTLPNTEPNAGAALAARELFEMLRAEISARGVCRRHLFLSRLHRFIKMQGLAVSPEDLSDSCDQLVQAGDICEGEQGVLASTPTRFLRLASGNVRLIGSIPLRNLELPTDVQLVDAGPVRQLDCDGDITGYLDFLRSHYGAMEISELVWSGLNRVSSPGDLLKQLDDANPQDLQAETTGSFVYPNQWQNYHPGPVAKSGKRWQAAGDQILSPLWKTMDRWQHMVFAWASYCPAGSEWSRISRDTAIRATYALDLARGRQLSVAWQKKGKNIVFDLPGYLPLAEYRYITLQGQIEPVSNGSVRLHMPEAGWPQVQKILHENLGLQFNKA